ncbi:MAG: hypothetical protein O6933_07745, partial [Planctomycetota bacterium]|nr:hypothetical protein [Planctomycetota bacterium]
MPLLAIQSGANSFVAEPVEALTDEIEPIVVSAMGLLNSYATIFIAAFLVTLLCTPLVRWLALAGNVTDQPDGTRKAHRYPVAY